MSVFYNAHDLPSTFVFDGCFDAYSVLCSCPRQDEALAVLCTLASVVEPFMKRRGLHINLLKEFLPEDHTLQGLNDMTPNSLNGIRIIHCINIRLRSYENPNEFLPPATILQIMCHELAHCWYVGHQTPFFPEWKGIMEEVDEDLGGMLRFRHIGGRYENEMRELDGDRELRLAARLSSMVGRRGIGCPKFMWAAKYWKDWYWSY
jgi:hypothetical protein